MAGLLKALEEREAAINAAKTVREALQSCGAPADENTVLTFLRFLDRENMSIRRGKGGRPKGSKNHTE